ncbi:hypothetical protein Bca4012_002706 [Brassica carinata]
MRGRRRQLPLLSHPRNLLRFDLFPCHCRFARFCGRCSGLVSLDLLRGSLDSWLGAYVLETAHCFPCCWHVCSPAPLSSSSVSGFCEVVFVVEKIPGFPPFPCLVSSIGSWFPLGSTEEVDVFYRFVHGGLMVVWLSSFSDSMSATSCRTVSLSSMAFSSFRFGGCPLFAVVSI